MKEVYILTETYYTSCNILHGDGMLQILQVFCKALLQNIWQHTLSVGRSKKTTAKRNEMCQVKEKENTLTQMTGCRQ